MDIFTTQLTRVVPVPIKPANLKVKALLKEAANSELTQDPNHLENHEYYFNAEEDEYHSGQQNPEQDLEKQQVKQGVEKSQGTEESTQDLSKSDGQEDSKNDKPNHLDLYA